MQFSEHTEQLVAKGGAGLTYTGSGVTIIAGFTLSEWGFIVGMTTAIVGLVIQYVFNRRRDKREAEVKKLEALWYETQIRKAGE